ncbi:TPA: hypothetical protein ACGUM0_004439 [Vibrio vulnificus]|uniref:hypothetical protein n=1 Tax=Vibrio vulnificus TaxID=672 RepID=UPI0019D4E399|nr:hypothetical protein [Vibrio vulnificus]MBN8091027.1 hypothetical protein [Vibrio vulnificus]MBN8119720.1 hypothetical protein [Vibrio vulnificus]
MRELDSIIINATNQIEAGYIRLRIDGGDPVYRERVYCYELYHQMRMVWPTNSEYYLNGEIDKAAHPILRELGASHIKPDFLVHKPGYMSGNHAIIEVKHERAPNVGIRKDLESLSLFKNEVGYERAIYLVYGYNINPEALFEKIAQESSAVENLADIEVWFHLSDSSSAFHYSTIEARA